MARFVRYYLLYYLTPIPVLAAVLAFDNPNPWIDALVASAALLIWWLLAIGTEENNRWFDMIEREYSE